MTLLGKTSTADYDTTRINQRQFERTTGKKRRDIEEVLSDISICQDCFY